MRFHLHLSACICGSLLLMNGCKESGERTSVRDRQDAALKDPYGYQPDVPRKDVSGGGMFEYDRDAMRKDVDSVLR